MTQRDTHIVQRNGYSRGPLVDMIRPYPDAIRYSLNRLNGSSTWAYSLWRAPEDADLLSDIPLSDEYMQSAGSAAAMTVEIRQLDADGVAHQYVVGKSGARIGSTPTEVIRWDDGRHSSLVHPHEVFTADEAAEIFYAYYLTNETPDAVVLREIDIDPKPPVV